MWKVTPVLTSCIQTDSPPELQVLCTHIGPPPVKKKKKKEEEKREEKKDGTGKAKFGTVEDEEAGLTHDATVTKHEALPGGNRRCGDACSHQRARCQSQSSGPRERDIWHSASSVMRLLRRLVDED